MIDFFFAPVSKGWFIVQVMCTVYILLKCVTSYIEYCKNPNKTDLIIYWVQAGLGIIVTTKTICFLAAGSF